MVDVPNLPGRFHLGQDDAVNIQTGDGLQIRLIEFRAWLVNADKTLRSGSKGMVDRAVTTFCRACFFWLAATPSSRSSITISASNRAALSILRTLSPGVNKKDLRGDFGTDLFFMYWPKMGIAGSTMRNVPDYTRYRFEDDVWLLLIPDSTRNISHHDPCHTNIGRMTSAISHKDLLPYQDISARTLP